LYKVERFETGSVMKNIILPIDGIAFALQKTAQGSIPRFPFRTEVENHE
jgi:hypothetical protein